jgi:hypothetical protein
VGQVSGLAFRTGIRDGRQDGRRDSVPGLVSGHSVNGFPGPA